MLSKKFNHKMNTVYKVIFRSSTHANGFAPSYIRPDTNVYLRDTLEHWYSPSLKFVR